MSILSQLNKFKEERKLNEDITFYLRQLISNGYCSYCCCRLFLINIDNNIEEKLLEEELLEIINNEIEFDTQSCIGCTGLLKQLKIQELSEIIYKKIESEGYEVDDFQVNIALAKGTLILEKLAKMEFLNLINNEINEEKFVSLKVILRNLIGKQIEKEFGLSYNLESKLNITITMEHEESDYLINNLEKEVDGYTIKWKKIQNSRSKVIENLRHINQQNVNLLYSLPIKKLFTTARFENINLLHDSIFIGGRYKKLERNISQTPWVINGIKKTKYSVSELIDENLKLFFKADNTNFVASGREDADVRMLGEGRPFSIELINPRIVKINEMQLKQLSDEINSNKLVNVVQLKWITKEELKKLKEGEEKKVKHYQCLCYASNIESELKLNQLTTDLPTNFDLLQDTPLRVLHRRSPMIRKKTIYSINYHFIKPNFILIKLQAEAGTYIKELVHGDMGRTLPNIKSLLQQKSMDLLELDVTKIDLQWP